MIIGWVIWYISAHPHRVLAVYWAALSMLAAWWLIPAQAGSLWFVLASMALGAGLLIATIVAGALTLVILYIASNLTTSRKDRR